MSRGTGEAADPSSCPVCPDAFTPSGRRLLRAGAAGGREDDVLPPPPPRGQHDAESVPVALPPHQGAPTGDHCSADADGDKRPMMTAAAEAANRDDAESRRGGAPRRCLQPPLSSRVSSTPSLRTVFAIALSPVKCEATALHVIARLQASRRIRIRLRVALAVLALFGALYNMVSFSVEQDGHSPWQGVVNSSLAVVCIALITCIYGSHGLVAISSCCPVVAYGCPLLLRGGNQAG